jgi:pimeloyl-ACP methyl ester carboxylesterase
MRGYGYSDKPDLPPEEGYTDEVMAGDLRALVEHLGFEKVNVVSHDFGSVWTQRFVRAIRFSGSARILPARHPGTASPLDRTAFSRYSVFHQLPWPRESLQPQPPRSTRVTSFPLAPTSRSGRPKR